MAYQYFPAIDPVETGKNIVRLRKERGLSVRDIQAWFNFEEPRAIYKWQSGQTLPSVDNLYALSVLLQVPMDSVIVGMENSKYNEPQEFPAAHHFCFCIRELKGAFYIMKRTVFFITCLLMATLLFCTNSYADDAYVTFGTYPQTSEGYDNTPIEWLVLDYDEVNNRALLISQYGLDAQPYNTDYKSVTWETCTLRAWLNNDFYNRAFSVNEQIAILLTNVDNSKSQGYGEWNSSGGNDTEDKVFLLSYSEANKYLGVTYDNIWDMEPRVSPTAYAKAQRAYTNDDYKTADGAAAGRWWLRSPGNYNDYAAYVFSDGALYYWTVNNDSFLVRPALWVNLDSDIFMAQQSLNPQFNR